MYKVNFFSAKILKVELAKPCEQYLQYYVNYVKFSSSALEIDVIMATLMQFW